MSMAIIAAVVAAGTAAYGIAESSNQKRRASHALTAAERAKPVDTMPTELTQNKEMATLRSNTGLPSEQYNLAMKNIQRQQAKTLASASDRKMGLGLISTIDDNANQAVASLDAKNAQQRLANQNQLMNVNNSISAWKTGKYNRDMADYNNKYDYAMALKGQGNQNITNSIMSAGNAAVAIGGAAYANKGNSDWSKGLFGNSSSARRTTYSGGGNEVTHYDTMGNEIISPNNLMV